MPEQRDPKPPDMNCSAQLGAEQEGYSVENAQRFGWGSLSHDLPEERLAIIDKYVIGPNVLDAGCGGGGYVDYLIRKGYEATGVDKYDMFLDKAKERGLKGRFVQANLAEPLPFENKLFDTTICFDVLEHVDDITVIKELARVTRQRIIIIVPQEDTKLLKYGVTLGAYRDQTHLRYYSVPRIEQLSAAAGACSHTIFPESVVHVALLARQWLTVKSRFPLLSRLYRWGLQFLLKRASASDLHQNFAVVFDLQNRSLVLGNDNVTLPR